MNRIIDTDSYKASHWTLYPPKTTSTFSYIESRGSEREYKETLFFGLQYFLNTYFATSITLEEVEEAKELITSHGMPFNYEGWLHIVNDHKGNLPLRIRAVREGSIIPTHLPLVTVESTCGKCFWIPSYFETVILRAVWYGTTVATQSYYLKKLIYGYLVKTADDPEEEIKFKLHDFGSRGVSSQESAAIGGAAHLVSFYGTDTMVALAMLRKHYDAPMAGFSIPAGEHSTFSSWGRDNEVDAYRNMLNHYGKPNAMLAVVSDTWDIYNACEKLWGQELKQEVIDSGATVVIRPDSGDPVKVLCGYKVLEVPEDAINAEYCSEDIYKQGCKYYAIEDFYSYGEHLGYLKGEELPYSENEVKGVLQILAEKFGTTINSKGYKVLNNIRVIQGDGVNPDSIAEILETMEQLGFSATNIAFGMGGALLQKVDRDTLKFAYKCSSATIDGVETDVWKDPITDKGKRSKKGRLDTVYGRHGAETVVLGKGQNEGMLSLMHTVFENGEIFGRTNLEEVRERASIDSLKNL